ncbi:MAG: hypothetical protein IT308_13555 [Anaerolineaceae bacterium]|nr:hypothetical protein [Anaerolineaceae bacterium]
MKKVDLYRAKLRSLNFWDDYLLSESGLPGPRGNLELAKAAALEGSKLHFTHWLTFTPEKAPANTPEEFLAFCGTLGLGKLICLGEGVYFAELRRLANDPRWRTREAVAMALQMIGVWDMEMLLTELEGWLAGSFLEQRAVAAGLCEPVLLRETTVSRRVLEILDHIMAGIEKSGNRKSSGFKTLRQALGYCWSVAAAALPEAGMKALEKWAGHPDPDIHWILRENLKKNRLVRLNREWVVAMLARL